MGSLCATHAPAGADYKWRAVQLTRSICKETVHLVEPAISLPEVIIVAVMIGYVRVETSRLGLSRTARKLTLQSTIIECSSSKAIASLACHVGAPATMNCLKPECFPCWSLSYFTSTQTATSMPAQKLIASHISHCTHGPRLMQHNNKSMQRLDKCAVNTIGSRLSAARQHT